MRELALIVLCFVSPAICFGQSAQKVQCPDKPAKNTKFIPLACVVQEVEGVLVAAQQRLKEQNIAFQLQSAEFDFQSITTNIGDIGVSSIITADYNKEKDVSQEVDYTYQVPDRQIVGNFFQSGNAAKGQFLVMRNFPTAELSAVDIFSFIKGIYDFFTRRTATTPAEVQKILPDAIVQAAEALRDVQVITPPDGIALPINNYVVTLTFTVSGTFTVGADASSLIVVSPTAKYSHESSNVQTIKLMFTHP